MADKQFAPPFPLMARRCVLGEGPIWNSVDQRLYWTDIPSKALHSCRADGSEHVEHLIGREVGGLTVQADGSLLLFMDRGSICQWNHGGLASIIDGLPELHSTRFNDVIATPTGQVFCGTMPAADNQSKVFLLNLDGTLELVQQDLGLANGMGFSCDGQTLYLTDSKAKRIWQFAFDQATGTLSGRRTLVLLTEQDDTPDGLTVDSEDCVWSARWGGGCVVRYCTNGRELVRVEVPRENVTSLAFGGNEMKTMYITTARSGSETEDEGGGEIFSAEAGVSGKPEYFSAVKL